MPLVNCSVSRGYPVPTVESYTGGTFNTAMPYEMRHKRDGFCVLRCECCALRYDGHRKRVDGATESRWW